MKRNLEDRVEVITPVEPEDSRVKLRDIVDAQLSDKRNAWEMQSDGTYIQLNAPSRADQAGSQEILIHMAVKRFEDAQRQSKNKVKKKILKRKRK